MDAVTAHGSAEAGVMSSGPEHTSSEGGFLSGVQFVLVSATMPRGLEKSIGAYIPVSVFFPSFYIVFSSASFFFSKFYLCFL